MVREFVREWCASVCRIAVDGFDCNFSGRPERGGQKLVSEAKQAGESLCVRKGRPPGVFLEGSEFV